jgi:hypothetical protein
MWEQSEEFVGALISLSNKNLTSVVWPGNDCNNLLLVVINSFV